MNWLFFAIIAPALDTVINFTDKYILEKEINDYRGMPVYTAIVAFIAGTIYWNFAGYPVLQIRDASLVLLTGMLSIWGLALYFKALMLDETSRIIVFFKAIPIFILGLSFVFLKESISIRQLIGFLLVLTAVHGVSQKNHQPVRTKGFFSSALGLILLVDCIWAIAAILIKFTIQLNSFANIISYESWGVALGGLLLYICFPSVRRAFHCTLATIRKRALLVLFCNEGIFVLSRAVTFYAYSLGSAALVSVIGTTQVFYGIFYGFILSTFAPNVFKEDTTTQTINKKILFAFLLVFGIYLIS